MKPMTDSEKQVWAAAFALSLHHSTERAKEVNTNEVNDAIGEVAVAAARYAVSQLRKTQDLL